MPKTIDYKEIARQLEDKLPLELDAKENKVVQAAWNAKVQSHFDVGTAFSKLEKELEGEAPKIVRFKAWYAAAVVAFLAIAFGVYQFLSPTVYETISGEQMTIQLEDESVVTLEGGSKLTVQRNFGESSRELTFQGKAKFVVSKNKNLSFNILSSQGMVTVLGTEFTYMDYLGTELLSLEVQEGKVAFKNNEIKETLLKGEAIYVSKGEVVRSKITDEISKFNFKKASIEDIVEVLEKSYGVQIAYDKKIAKEQLNLGFSTNLIIEEILEILTQTTDQKFSIKQK